MELCRKAEASGIDLTAQIESGHVEVVCPSPLGAIADAHAELIFANVRARGVRRLFIDGLGGFRDSLVYEDRTRRFFRALCNELRSLGVVTLLSDETRNLDDLELPAHGLAGMLDNVISLRHIEVDARLEKLLAVTKMRGIAGDSSVRGFWIDSGGFQVSMDSKSALAMLGGGHSKATKRQRPSPPAKKTVRGKQGKVRGGRNAR
jgi:circadian clock protein KaiC